jgi:hypothetical protein
MTKTDKQALERIEKVFDLVNKIYDKTYISTRKLLFKSFLTGMFTALGATVGVSIMVGLISYVLSQPPVKYLFPGEVQVKELFEKK